MGYQNGLTECVFLDQIKRLQRNSDVEHEFSIFWVPRRTLVSNQILEEEGVIGDVNIAEFPLYFLPLENDVLSLELADSFSDLYLVYIVHSLITTARCSHEIRTATRDLFTSRLKR